MKQEFATADSHQFNGVAERVLGLIDTAAMAGRIQAQERFPARNSLPLYRCGRERSPGRVTPQTAQERQLSQRESRRIACGTVASPR